MQIGINNEAEVTDGVNLADVLRQGVGHPLLNFHDLEALTRAYVQDEKLEDELLRLLRIADQGADRGHSGQQNRFLDRYIRVLQKVRGLLLPAVQADALILIAQSM